VTTASRETGDADLTAAVWDLETVVDGGPEAAQALLSDAARRAGDFAARYGGRVLELDALELAAAAQEWSGIRETMMRAFMYAWLSHQRDLSDAAAGALYASVAERRSEIEQALRFFELEWGAGSRDAVERLLVDAAPGVEFAAHHLRRVHDAASEQLSVAEERVLSETSTTSRFAWVRLANELISGVQCEVDGEQVGVGAYLSMLEDPDRGVRQRFMEGFVAAQEPGLETRASVYNALLQGHATLDRLRGRHHWLDAQNRENEISGEAVQALVDAVVGRYDISHRWHRLKARLLGLDRLADFDVLAPIGVVERRYSYAEARELVLDSYGSLSAGAREIVARFFDEGWIDAAPGPTKFPGAFCDWSATVHPHVLLNYRGRIGDVLTIAHELGHGLHGVLAAPRGTFDFMPAITIAETASTFGETLLIERLLVSARDDRERLGIISRSIDNALLPVHWQIAFNRFEDAAHTARRAEGELSPEALGDLYSQAIRDYYGEAVEPTAGSENGWSTVPHFFFDTPGYVYSYAFGQLLALAAYARYQQIGEPFVNSYLAMLAAGSSRDPQQLVEMIGFDLSDPGFWNLGLDLIDARLREAEKLADDHAS
jgi:oligoendopeptidase F